MLSWLRRHIVPAVSALTILFVVQTFDLFLCQDEVRERTHEHAAGDAAGVPAGGFAQHPVPDHGPDGDGGPALPDCLCHYVFTRTDVIPALAGSPSAMQTAFFPFPTSPHSVEPDPLDHVPLA